ncbi:plasmid mobilization protein [Pannonibacter sp. SL95]|uniref:plasmid mobilization protein n=1 Tax=Pannonibacter sp. SL95 TaxID=2995153 RepID=UPI003FA3BB9C
MRQDTIIKFRATSAEKARLHAAAERSGRTVSALLRKAASEAAAGRQIDRLLHEDLVALRRSLNTLLADDGMRSREALDSARKITTRVLARVP